MNDNIKIIDWACNILYQGDHKSEEVDTILTANRCTCDSGCDECAYTGYLGDFHVEWEDESKAPYVNVYECINY